MATCRTLVEEFGGEVPEDYETLLKLPGVGRKTANVVVEGHAQSPPGQDDDRPDGQQEPQFSCLIFIKISMFIKKMKALKKLYQV